MTEEGKDGRGGAKQQQQQKAQAELLLRTSYSSCHPRTCVCLWACVVGVVSIMRQGEQDEVDRKSETAPQRPSFSA